MFPPRHVTERSPRMFNVVSALTVTGRTGDAGDQPYSGRTSGSTAADPENEVKPDGCATHGATDRHGIGASAHGSASCFSSAGAVPENRL